MALDAAQASRSAGTRRGGRGQAFGEAPPWTGRGIAAEPPHAKAQRGNLSLPGEVGQGALIMAVHSPRRAAAQRAKRSRRPGLCDNDDPVRLGQDLRNLQVLRKAQHEKRRQRNPHTIGAERSTHMGMPTAQSPSSRLPAPKTAMSQSRTPKHTQPLRCDLPQHCDQQALGICLSKLARARASPAVGYLSIMMRRR